MENEVHKPTLGLKPKNLHDRDRIYDIIYTLERRIRNDDSIELEWILELKELVETNFT
jgi:hypothetical protein